MAIGKPLLVQERKGVAKPVLSPQTQQLSTNVGAQKIEMADYNIGMNNAMASQQVTGELVSMVNAGINAKVYAEQTKQQYNRLNLMEDWNKTDNEFKVRFAKAILPEEQEVVMNDFAASLETRTANYRKGGGTGLPTGDSIQSQRDLSSLRNRSNNLYSKFATTMNTNINTRTNSMLDLRMAKALQDGKMNKNADPVSIMNTVKESLAQKVAIGGITQDRAMFNLEVATNKFIVDRGSLYAKDLAREQVKNGIPPSSPDELRKSLSQVMGFDLKDSQVKILDETLTDTYYKELAVSISQNDAEEKMAWQLEEDKYIQFKTSVIKDISDGLLTGTSEETYLEKAKVYDAAHPGRGILNEIQKLVSSHKNGASTKRYVDYWTTGEGGDQLRIMADNPNGDKADGYYNIPDIKTALHNQALTEGYEGMNINTELDITKFFEKANKKIITDLGSKSPDITKAVISNMVQQPKTDFAKQLLKSMETGADTKLPFFKAITSTGLAAHDWEKIVSGSAKHGAAYSAVQSWVNTNAANKTGPFNAEHMNLPPEQRFAIVRDAIKERIEIEFTKSIALTQQEIIDKQELDAKNQAAAQQAQEEATAEKIYNEYFDPEKKNFKYKPDIGFRSRVDSLSTKGLSLTDKVGTFLEPEVEAIRKTGDDLVQVGQQISQGVKSGWVDTFLGGDVDKFSKTKRKWAINNVEQSLDRRLTAEDLENPEIQELITQNIKVAEEEAGAFYQYGKLISDSWSLLPFTDDSTYEEGTEREKYDLLVETLTNESKEKISSGIGFGEGLTFIEEGRTKGVPPEQKNTQPLENTISDVVSSIGSLLSPTEATAGDTPLESTARYFDAENQPTDVIPQEVWNRLPKHSLLAGDTLSDLANQYNISIEELQRLNPQTVGRETALQIGEQIALPSTTGESLTPDKSGMYPPPKTPEPFYGRAYREPDDTPESDTFYGRAYQGAPIEDLRKAVTPEALEVFLKSREATPAEAVADVGSGVDSDGAGYGHILNEKEKKWWKSASTKQREAKANKWFKEDMVKAKSAAKKQIASIRGETYEVDLQSRDKDAMETMLTSVNFQLGTDWRKKFPKAWAGIRSGLDLGTDYGTTPMFKDKSGWEQAVYHLMHANETTNEPSKWLIDSPRRVMDAVLAIDYMRNREPNDHDNIIEHIDNILEGLK